MDANAYRIGGYAITLDPNQMPTHKPRLFLTNPLIKHLMLQLLILEI
jgi:hypothetical protein